MSNNITEYNTLYRLVSSYRDSNGEYIIVAKLLAGIGKVFKISASELVTRRRDLLESFPVDDIISIVGIASSHKTPNIVEKKLVCYHYFVLLAVLFSGLLLLANIVSVKLISIFGFILPAGLLAYAAMYAISNVVTEVYGYKRMRFLIWISTGFHILSMLYLQASVALPAADSWQNQEHYAKIIGNSITYAIAVSVISYLVGEFANSYIISRMKLIYNGRFLLLRIIAASFTGICLDTMIFVVLAYWQYLPLSELWTLIVRSIVIKLALDVISIPGTLMLIRYIKHKEKIDIYDENTDFNFFSLDVEYTEKESRFDASDDK